jgi:hypothetical protein
MSDHRFTIDKFCESHGFGRRTFFNLRRRGLAPETVLDGRRLMITPEAASEWRLRAGEPLVEGDLAEIVALTMRALPELTRELGGKAGILAYYRRLGTVLEALGVLEPHPGNEETAHAEEMI